MDQAAQFDYIGVKGVMAFYFQALELYSGQSWINRLANRFISNQASETYASIGTVPQMREWIGGKQPKGFTEQSLIITNKDFESTIRIKNKDRRRDKTGLIQARMGELAQRTISHDASLLSTLIQNGAGTTVATCYDGKALFADDHSVGSSGTIDNNISVDISALPTGDTTGSHGSTTAPSIGEMALSIMQAITTLYGFKDDQGEPINEFAREFVVMVPASLAGVAQAAVSVVNFAQGMTNPLLSIVAPSGDNIRISVAVNVRLTWTDKFAVFRADAPFKPFIIQLEVEPIMKALAEGSDNEFNNNEVLFSVEKSGNVGLGRFDEAVLVTMT
jgi:phage major head subunit gpT-like protein